LRNNCEPLSDIGGQGNDRTICFWAENNEEEVIQSDSLLQGLNFPKNDIKVHSLSSQFKLSFRSNCDLPPKRYVPEDRGDKKVKYPITSYTRTNHLSEPLNNFVLQVSSISVPNIVSRILSW
jgi:hypothetical protein